MKIQGFQMHAVGAPLRPTTLELGSPSDHEVIVEVLGCGVCHTDLGFLDDGVKTRHPLPLVLGHEVVGKVVAHGGEDASLLGQTVIVPAVMPCGSCELCEHGRGDICPRQIFPGNDDHGGFASHLKVPSLGLCPVPDDRIDTERRANLSVIADAVSTAYQAVKKSNLRDGGLALFVGIGGVGGFGVQIARSLGARVLAIDVDDGRLARIAEHGADWTLNAGEYDARQLKKQVRGLAKENGLPATEWRIFETSGTPAGQETAFSLLVPGAYLGVVGFSPKPVTVRLSNLMAFAAKAEGTWGCDPELFPEVLELVLTDQVSVDPFVQQFPMSQINDVFDQVRRHELDRRPVLIPDFA